MTSSKKKKIIAKSFLLIMMVLIFSAFIPSKSEAAVKLNKKSLTLLKGKTYTLKIKGTTKKATWKTSKKSVAKLNQKKKNKVTIKGMKAGTAIVSAKIGNKIYRCKVTVVSPKLNKTSLTLTVGDTSTLSVSKGTGKILWKSANPSIASVTSDGKVTAKKAGTIKITAKQNGKTLTCIVTVKKKVMSETDTGEVETPDNDETTSDQPNTNTDITEKTLYSYKRHALEIVKLINQYRAQYNITMGWSSEDSQYLEPYIGNDTLEYISRITCGYTVYNYDILSYGDYAGHYTCQISCVGIMSPSDIVNAWIESPDHEPELRQQIKYVGVACYIVKAPGGIGRSKTILTIGDPVNYSDAVANRYTDAEAFVKCYDELIYKILNASEQ